MLDGRARTVNSNREPLVGQKDFQSCGEKLPIFIAISGPNNQTVLKQYKSLFEQDCELDGEFCAQSRSNPVTRSANMALTNPRPEDSLKLFQDIEKHFPSSTLGDDKWQILAVCISPTSSGTY